jgi:hypothetical protein
MAMHITEMATTLRAPEAKDTTRPGVNREPVGLRMNAVHAQTVDQIKHLTEAAQPLPKHLRRV